MTIRELTLNETAQVSGSDFVADTAAWGGGFGGLGGAAIAGYTGAGINSTALLVGTGIGYGGVAGFSFGLGWTVGTWIYETFSDRVWGMIY